MNYAFPSCSKLSINPNFRCLKHEYRFLSQAPDWIHATSSRLFSSHRPNLFWISGWGRAWYLNHQIVSSTGFLLGLITFPCLVADRLRTCSKKPTVLFHWNRHLRSYATFCTGYLIWRFTVPITILCTNCLSQFYLSDSFIPMRRTNNLK